MNRSGGGDADAFCQRCDDFTCDDEARKEEGKKEVGFVLSGTARLWFFLLDVIRQIGGESSECAESGQRSINGKGRRSSRL